MVYTIKKYKVIFICLIFIATVFGLIGTWSMNSNRKVFSMVALIFAVISLIFLIISIIKNNRTKKLINKKVWRIICIKKEQNLGD